MPRPFSLFTRRVGPIGLALTAFDIWRRLPAAQRRQILAATRKHGPRIAAGAVKRGRAARAARKRV